VANTDHEHRSPEEREFWDRRFDVVDGPVPGEPVAEHDPLAGPDPAVGSTPSRPFGTRPVPRPLAPEPDTVWVRALEWLRDRRGDPRLGVVALVAVAVVAGFVWYRIGVAGGGDAPPAAARTRSSAASTPVTVAGGETEATASDPKPQRSTDARATTVVVHVAGAVARPGVIELPKAARVIDALEAVGGATPDADVDRLNLAAPVVDGARVYVPRRGEADPGVVGGGGATGGTGDGAPAGKINLNTATEEQLEALPGIGPTYAQAIVAERTRRNGFRSVNELREVRGIGEKRFAELAPLVTV
jgi:competence protein ComEA